MNYANVNIGLQYDPSVATSVAVPRNPADTAGGEGSSDFFDLLTTDALINPSAPQRGHADTLHDNGDANSIPPGVTLAGPSVERASVGLTESAPAGRVCFTARPEMTNTSAVSHLDQVFATITSETAVAGSLGKELDWAGADANNLPVLANEVAFEGAEPNATPSGFPGVDAAQMQTSPAAASVRTGQASEKLGDWAGPSTEIETRLIDLDLHRSEAGEPGELDGNFTPSLLEQGDSGEETRLSVAGVSATKSYPTSSAGVMLRQIAASGPSGAPVPPNPRDPAFNMVPQPGKNEMAAKTSGARASSPDYRVPRSELENQNPKIPSSNGYSALACAAENNSAVSTSIIPAQMQRTGPLPQCQENPEHAGKVRTEPVEIAPVPLTAADAGSGTASPAAVTPPAPAHAVAHTAVSAGAQPAPPISDPLTPPTSTGTTEQSRTEETPLPEPHQEFIQGARFLDRMGHSEMRIGLHSVLFGCVEVHTVVRENQVGLSIASEKGDLRTLFAPEVGTVAAALRHYGLQLNPVEFLDAGVAPGNAFSPGTDAQPQSFDHPARHSWRPAPWRMDSDPEMIDEPVFLPSATLSIRV